MPETCSTLTQQHPSLLYHTSILKTATHRAEMMTRLPRETAVPALGKPSAPTLTPRLQVDNCFSLWGPQHVLCHLRTQSHLERYAASLRKLSPACWLLAGSIRLPASTCPGIGCCGALAGEVRPGFLEALRYGILLVSVAMDVVSSYRQGLQQCRL